MIMKPKISVVTINYNNSSVLSKTIESVIGQTYPNKEYIIIDGQSTDGSIDIINSYQDNITKIIIEPDNGPYNAMNKGLTVASGNYIIFINSGDRLVDGILNRIFNSDIKNADIIYGNFYVTLNDKIQYIADLPSFPGISFFYDNNINHQSAFIKTSIHKLHPYDESYMIAADFNLFFNLLIKKNHTYLFISEPISYYDLSGMSANQKYHKLHIEERSRVLTSYLSKSALAELEALKIRMATAPYKYLERIRDNSCLTKTASLLLSLLTKFTTKAKFKSR